MTGELLPKPEETLPKPELEIPANAGSTPLPVINGEVKGNKLKFLLIVILAILVLGGIAFGAYEMSKNSSKPSPSSSTNINPSPTPVTGINFSNSTFDEFCNVGGCLEDASSEADLALLKTYEGEGFGFNYPSDWKISKAQSINSGIGEIILTRQSRTATENYYSSEIKIYYQEQDLPLKDWFKHNFINSVYQTVNEQDLDQSTPATIDGKDAIFLGKLPGVPLYDGDRIAFINGRIGYALSLSGTEADAKSIYTILSSFKFTDKTSHSATQNFLEIPEFGIKIPLTDNNKDAYYVMKTSNGLTTANLRVHSLDSESYCNDGIAFLTKISKGKVDERTKAIIDSGNATLIGNYYYFIEGEQAVCSQKTSNQTTETNARKGFTEASRNIIAI